MEKVKLTEICNPKQWKTLATSKLKNDGKYLVYGANGIIGYYDEYNHEKETVLITCRGATCGNVHISKEKSYVNGNAMALEDLNENICLKEYLYYFLKQYDMKKVISGSAQPQITVQSLKNIDIRITDVNTQTKIVTKLNIIQQILDIRKKQIEELDELIKSQFVEMFDIYSCKEYALGECTNFIDYRGHTPEVSTKGLIRMVNAKSVGKGNFKYVDEYITQELYDKWMHRGFAYPGDILFVTEGHTFGNCCRVPDDLKKFALGQRVITIQGKENINNIFLCYYMQLDDFKNKINMYKTGGTAQGIRSKDLVKILIPIPPIELQNQFADFVKQIDKQKFVKQTIKELTKLKETFIQKYLKNNPKETEKQTKRKNKE